MRSSSNPPSQQLLSLLILLKLQWLLYKANMNVRNDARIFILGWMKSKFISLLSQKRNVGFWFPPSKNEAWMSWKAWIASLVYTVIFAHTGPANCQLAQTRTVSSIQILLNPPMVTLSKGKEPLNFHWTFQELGNADAIQYWPHIAPKRQP